MLVPSTWSMIALVTLALSACPWERMAPSPDCDNPAPLLGEPGEATAYIVVFHEGTPAAQTTAALAAKYDFTPRHVYEHALQGFAAELSAEALAGIRCEAVVLQVEHDQEFTVR